MAVELAKRWSGYRGVTGDWFATIAPLGIAVGRVGCWLHGCCRGRAEAAHWWTLPDAFGVERWPAVPVEIVFNLGMAAVFFAWRRGGRFTGQHFLLYLIGYGLFRFGHEFLRDTPRVSSGLSGYQWIALGVAAFGWWRFVKRRSEARERTRQALPEGKVI